jgi:MFS family permease
MVWKRVSLIQVSLFGLPPNMNEQHGNISGSCAVQPLVGKFYSYFHLKVRPTHSPFNSTLGTQLLIVFKWTFFVFLGIFELGSLLCGISTSSQMLIVGRAFAGAGGAGLVNGGFVITSACVPLRSRPGKTFEHLSVPDILANSNPDCSLHGYAFSS